MASRWLFQPTIMSYLLLGITLWLLFAPRTAAAEPSLELARRHYPQTEIRGDLSAQKGFFNCAKAERLIGWRHED